jgi:hypothetical protein
MSSSSRQRSDWKVRVVQAAECLRADLQPELLGDPEILEQANGKVLQTGPTRISRPALP